MYRKPVLKNKLVTAALLLNCSEAYESAVKSTILRGHGYPRRNMGVALARQLVEYKLSERIYNRRLAGLSTPPSIANWILRRIIRLHDLSDAKAV